jgi:hypothetical protein
MQAQIATTERMGGWIQTYSGIAFYPIDPRPEEIHYSDIAHALSMICRFTGHTKKFYSVAQHCVLVSQYCDPQDALWGLLHDASEAYMCDVARPVKHMDFMRPYRIQESKLMRVIAQKFGLSEQEPESVQVADRRLLYTEARDLMNPVHPDWEWLAEPYPEKINPWSPKKAEEMFLIRFVNLIKKG